MTVLITGGENSLSLELSKIYKDVLVPNSNKLNLTNKKSIENFFEKNDFDIIIHN